MKFRIGLLALSAFAITATGPLSTAHADGMDEINEWRRRSGLPAFTEDPEMTRFAEMKARYRAERRLQNGHQGPKPPAGWHEGTGEATPTWGWLTCESESDFKYAGAAVCIGTDGTRYMVLVCREGSGRALLPRNHSPVHRTAYLSPAAPRAGRPGTVATSGTSRGSKVATVQSEPAKVPCPDCGKFH